MRGRSGRRTAVRASLVLVGLAGHATSFQPIHQLVVPSGLIPTGNAMFLGSAVSTTVMIETKVLDHDERATGPNFPITATLTVNIANVLDPSHPGSDTLTNDSQASGQYDHDANGGTGNTTVTQNGPKTDASVVGQAVVVRNSAPSFTNAAKVDGDQTDPVPGNYGGAASTHEEGGNEICGNCEDDDGDGRVDYEDPDCCEQTSFNFGSTTVRPLRGGRARFFEVKGEFASPIFDGVAPRREGMTVQMRNAAGQLSCCTVEASLWRRLERRHVGFWDSSVGICPPVKDFDLRTRPGQRTRFRVRTGHVSLADYLQLVTVTLRAGDRCASGNVTPVTKR
jgi:hypothetical protein